MFCMPYALLEDAFPLFVLPTFYQTGIKILNLLANSVFELIDMFNQARIQFRR